MSDRWTEAKLSHGGVVSGRPDLVANAVAIDQDMNRQEREWVEHLRARGVKAAHPDDGWVDRQKNTVQFAYPHFNDRPSVGDVIALGCGWRSEEARAVRVAGITRTLFGYVLYHFVEIGREAIS
jgi:hypothetical protein